MTDDRMALVELIEQGADSDLVRQMLAFAAERIMVLEIEAKTGVNRPRLPEASFLKLGSQWEVVQRSIVALLSFDRWNVTDLCKR